MKAVVTRVTEASVTIDGKVNGRIGTGFLVLLGIAPEDTEAEAIRLADRVCGVRVFEDADAALQLRHELIHYTAASFAPSSVGSFFTLSRSLSRCSHRPAIIDSG